jgi:uncharacterized protein
LVEAGVPGVRIFTEAWLLFGHLGLQKVNAGDHPGGPPAVALARVRAYVSRETRNPETAPMAIDDNTRTELEAAVYRRLVEHLRGRTDVQNIDMMNLAGFCRNCLSNWMKDAADAKGIPMTKDESREIVYGEPFEQWKAKHQKDASADQKAAFAKAAHKH